MLKPLGFYFYDLLRLMLGPQRARRLAVDALVPLGLFPERREKLAKNIRRILGHARGKAPDEAEVQRLCESLSRRYAHVLCDTCALMHTPEALLSAAQPAFLPGLKELLKKGKGVILATPHFGSEPVLYAFMDRSGIPTTLMVNDEGSYRWVRALYPSLRIVGLGQGAARGLKSLRANEVFILNPDLSYFPKGRTVPFFGAPYPPPHGTARMALVSGAPILPVYAIPDGEKHRLESDPAIAADAPGGQAEIEQKLLASMEKRISAHPDLWFIFHDAWDLEAVKHFLGRQLASIRFKRGLRSKWLARD